MRRVAVTERGSLPSCPRFPLGRRAAASPVPSRWRRDLLKHFRRQARLSRQCPSPPVSRAGPARPLPTARPAGPEPSLDHGEG